MKQFIIPEIGFSVCAVYKMVFDNSKFYIGCSVDVRSRMTGWKAILIKGKKKNILITEAFKDCSVVEFQILEIVNGKKNARIEERYIKTNWKNPLLLNRSRNAQGNGVKKTDEYKLNQRKIAANKRKVSQYDVQGNFIETFESLADAARKIGLKSISRCFLQEGLTAGGFIFKKVG